MFQAILLKISKVILLVMFLVFVAKGFPLTANSQEQNNKTMEFDPVQAIKYLEQVCAIGTRVSGSEGMAKQRELIVKHFESLGARVTVQEFKATQRSMNKPVDMANIVVSWHPSSRERIILCSHYDTRPRADQETDPKKRSAPFVSANDGGSGIALLMELGKSMKSMPLKVGVDFVFFDGEEFVFDPDDEYFFGSKHFAREARKNSQVVKYRAAVLLDMVGGKNARFPIEQNSWWKAAPLVREIWSVAQEMKVTTFTTDFSRVAVEDDHIPLNNGGIPAIDIIDFDYKHWHKISDTPDQCSGDTMSQVARVLSSWLQKIQ